MNYKMSLADYLAINGYDQDYNAMTDQVRLSNETMIEMLSVFTRLKRYRKVLYNHLKKFTTVLKLNSELHRLMNLIFGTVYL